jgi:negative regulator of flagellin synthesis FlgM
MEIDKTSANQVRLPIRGPETTPGPDQPEAARARPEQARRDSLSISVEARERQAALKAVQEAPDVRADRVAELRRRIAEGTYYVSAETLARDILGGP